MATIRLDVQVNNATAKAGIQEVEGELAKLIAAPATVNINVKGAQAAANTIAKISLEEEKTNRERIKQEGLTARALEKTTQEELKNARAAQQVATANQDAASTSNVFAIALGNIAARGFHMVISKITQGIREAVTTMKDVDTQLTNISKVSGITGKALSDMGERAYETASKYGVAADEYLSAVYTFQKAGLGESAEAMGELAVKTMLVGDTTADVASQFLISANAAWKYGGNMEKLNQLVDEADYINNNYATDLTKLSQGLPRVASVAAQAGMSAEETLAALGTITAVTQESGTKAATALRALILNIEGEVGDFVDETGESFSVTEESVKSMQGLMEKYAKAELDAARASGELINPMTAIKAIFEGMANSDLNDQELFTLLSGMGGKLRTNQLTALVQNYKLFDDMLGKIANSAGTADGEIELMMDSWERKTQVLKNTWTEFVADVVDSDEIKAAIDGLTQFIDTLDTLLFSSASEQTKNKYKDLYDEMQSLERNSSRLTAQEKERLAYLRDQTAELERQGNIQSEQEAKNWQLKHGRQLVGTNLDGTPLYADQAMYESLTAGWSQAGANFAVGNLNGSDYIAAMKKVVEANRDYYENLIKCKEAGVDLTDWQEKFVTDYEGVQKAAESSSVSLRENADGYWEIVDAQGNVVAWTDKYKTAEERAAEAAQKEADATAEAAKHQEELNNQNENTRDWANYQQEMAQAMAEYDASIADAQTSTSDLATGADAAAESTADIGTNAKSIDFADAIAQAQALADALAMGSSAAAGIHVNIGGGSGGGGGIPSRAKGTSNAEGGATLVNELGPELISENGKAYIANGGKPAIVNLSKGAIVLPANVTKDALNGGVFGGAIKAAAGGLGDRDGGGSTSPRYSEPTGPAAEAQRLREQAIRESTSWKCPKCGTVNPAGYTKCYKCGTKNPKTGGGNKPTGGGGGGKKKSKKEKAQEAAEKLTEKLKNLDKQAELALNRKQYDKAISIYKQAISLIKKQINVYKKAGYKEKSNEILDLRNMIFDYEAKIESAQKAKTQAQEEDLEGKTNETLSNLDSQASLARDEERWDDEADIYNQAMSLIDQQIEAYRAAGYDENSNEILDLKKRRKDYEKKLKDVAKAKEDAIKSQIVGDSDERLSNIGAQISLAESEKRYEDEKKLYEDAIGIIDQQISAYKAAGYDENSDEVLALRQKRKDYEDKLTDVTKAIIEGESGAVLDNLSRQASLARTEKRYKDEAALYEEAIAIVNRQIEAYKAAGYGENSDEILELRSNLIDLQEKRKSVEQSQWDDLLDALKSDIDAQSQAEQLAERQKALEEAQQALENVGNQRTVRVFNASTGQWEWVSDASSTKNAQGNLESAQKSYDEYIRSRALADMQKARDEGLAFDMGNLGPQVSASALARINSPEVLEYAKKLDAIYGGATFQDLVAVGTGTANGGDSHDTIYNFGSISMSEAEAQSTTVADLARRLSVLKIS